MSNWLNVVGATFEARHFIFQTKTCSGIDMHKTEIPTLNSKEKKHRVEVNSFLLPREHFLPELSGKKNVLRCGLSYCPGQAADLAVTAAYTVCPRSWSTLSPSC